MNPGKAPMSGGQKEKRTEHTPTPWTFDIKADGAVVISTLKDDRQTVMFQHGANGNVPYRGVSEDAAFIVKVVNCHEELLEVVKQFADHLNENYDEDHVPLMEMLNRLIAKAEGRQ